MTLKEEIADTLQKAGVKFQTNAAIEKTVPHGPRFRLSGKAEVKHLNVRKEGPDDDKVLAVDIKLTFSKVGRSLCAYFDDALEAFLWRGETTALIARNYYLGPVNYGNQISDATAVINGHRFHGCDIRKFAIEPKDGGVIDLTCSVSLYPTASEVSDLAKIVQDEAEVTLEGPPDLFEGGKK